MVGTLVDLEKQEPSELAASILELHQEASPWLDEFAEALDRKRAGHALARILDVWGLTQSDASRLFGVTRQAVSKWLDRGAPSERVEVLADLSAATDLLVRYLKRDRIPAVVRRPAEAFDGLSLVDLVKASRSTDVLDACRSMFDFDQATG